MDRNDGYFKPGQLFKLSYLIGRIKSIRSFKDLMQRLYSACVLFYKVAAFRYGKKYWKRLEEIRDLSKKAGLFVEQGKASAREGRYAEAEEEFKEAIKIDAKSEAAHQELGKVYYIQNRLSEAEEELGKAIKINKKNRNTQLLLAKVYSAENKYVPALDAFFKLISPGMDNTGIYTEIEIVYGISKEYDKAIKGYKEVIARGVDDGRIHIALAKVYVHKEEYGNAIVEYKKAMERGGDDINVHLDIARAYYKNAQHNLAIEECAKVQETAPSLEALRIMIQVYKKLKNFDLCIQTGNEYIKMENEKDKEYNKKLLAIFSVNKINRGREKELTVKIIRTPYFEKKPEDKLDYCLLPPIGIARIASYLMSNGIKVDKDDLYIKVNHDNMFGNERDRIDREVFFDEKRVLEYVQGKDDIDIESIFKKTEERTKLEGYNVILISLPAIVGNTSGYMFVLSFARYLKGKYNPVIIIGGLDDTVVDMIRYDNKNIDFIIKGKGEKPLFMLLSALKYGIDVRKIPDISIENDGKLIATDLHSKLDVVPDFSGLPLELYEYKSRCKPDDKYDDEAKEVVNGFNNSKVMVSPFVMTEGCSYECAFCGDSFRDIIFSLTPKRVVEHIRTLNERYGTKYIFFLNNTINLSKKYMNEFCDEIINSGLDILWSDCARADNLDRDTLLKMRKAGCIRLIYGMETASPRLLRYIDKQINLKRLEDILSWTDEAGIWTGIEIICGFPGETKEDIKMTVEFLNKNKKHVNTIFNNIFYLIGGSKMFLYAGKYGIRNIIKTDTYKYERDRLRGVSRNAFDEADGLKWEDKLKQMSDAYDYMQKITNSNSNYLTDYDAEHMLFYMYSKYKDKKEIVRIFDKLSGYKT
ncbi:MAG: tetratricopeptide repeat protein [Elusimicrobia bacterium]|nr:tetratricopeptide repeat protein [Candidatus Liberimonas magnetica]